MKIISWNVNGIRANIKKGFYEFIKNVDPDILCLQETRGYPEDIDNYLPYFEKYWSHADKKGYSGTAIFVRKGIKHENVKEGIDNKKHIGERVEFLLWNLSLIFLFVCILQTLEINYCDLNIDNFGIRLF